MIPRANITAWRGQAPWVTDAQVEQDLVISRAIIEIFSDATLAGALAFRGGTALHKLFFKPARRYSEDIDLVQVRAEPMGPVMTVLRERLDPWLGRPTWKQSEGRVSLTYRFESEGLPATRMRLKVEINTREHFAVHGHIRHRAVVENPWFTGEADVVTFELAELLATKLRALYQRKKGRDLFDLAVALETHAQLDCASIVECFEAYMKHSGAVVSRAEFEANLAGKEADTGFMSDMRTLLAVALPPASDSDIASNTEGVSTYDAREALRLVRRGLIARLPGEPWRGRAPA
ncbi:MAG: nucleotidyl transferase AbiEii/AbiGii toxin family protein [Sandaracinaceae bacterium]|nr:nucleotidyl transferase AbiEii/AbiGii toxin family protein [Sandaracinaceae bacterium]